MSYCDRPKLDETKGKTLDKIAVKPGEETLILFFADGTLHMLGTDADCCSQTWWADIIGAKSAYGGKVTGFRQLDLPEPTDRRSRSEEDQVYGYALDTDRGSVTLAFRNASNGYYGGSCFKVEDPVLDPASVWNIIETNDWSA